MSQLSTSWIYENRRVIGQRMTDEHAHNALLQLTGKLLIEPQAQDGLASSSKDLHVMDNSRAGIDIKNITIGTKDI